MATRTGATPEQLLSALRQAGMRNYDESTVDDAITCGVITSQSLLGTLDDWSGFLVRPDEAIVNRNDLRVILKKALESPNPTRQSDAAYDRLRAAIEKEPS